MIKRGDVQGANKPQPDKAFAGPADLSIYGIETIDAHAEQLIGMKIMLRDIADPAALQRYFDQQPALRRQISLTQTRLTTHGKPFVGADRQYRHGNMAFTLAHLW